jgi:predicted RNase H-like HicB family nuclease
MRLEYWRDGRWFVGRLPQAPGVFSQGATLAELESNILDAYLLMQEEQREALPPTDIMTKEIEISA